MATTVSVTDTTPHPPLVPVHGEMEPDPGCLECGTCISHDGCADDQHPLQEGDCESCGACRDCIKECEQMRQTSGQPVIV